ncbi:hypothetical protein [Streptomyces jumonjinensis]|uniref:hypothetical protein n=1 Tax=Streptomyces jumonjinensis TaxID=1945 RepID=UPI0037A988B0
MTLPEPGRRAFFLVRHWAAGAGAWRETHLDSSCDILPDELDSAYRTVLHDRLRRRKNEVARHATIRHLPLVRITLHDTPAKVIYAFPTASRVEILALPAPWRTAWAAGVVTVVAAALCLLAAVIR